MCVMYQSCIYASDLPLGGLISNTSWWGMQLKCIVRKRFVDESGIRERYERYIAKAAIYGIINYTPISVDAIHSVCALFRT